MPSRPVKSRLLTLQRSNDICLVIGNGRSLLDVPVELLRKYDSFGTNRIYLLEVFTPRFYVAVNPLVVQQFADDINLIECEKKFITDTGGAHKLIADAVPIRSLYIPLFSRDALGVGVYEGYTVTFVAMQIAYAMGYKTVLLVGVDHDYKFDGVPNEERIAEGDDPNHFSPDYFGDGVRWNNPDLVQSERSYRMARREFERIGGRIINLTPETKETVFEKGSIREWLLR